MPFAIRNLSILAYANGFTSWHYKNAKGKLEDVMEDGYFNEADDMLTFGDAIIVSAIDGAMNIVVNSEGFGRVTVSRFS